MHAPLMAIMVVWRLSHALTDTTGPASLPDRACAALVQQLQPCHHDIPVLPIMPSILKSLKI
jgi:hypothetical protein